MLEEKKKNKNLGFHFAEIFEILAVGPSLKPRFG